MEVETRWQINKPSNIYFSSVLIFLRTFCWIQLISSHILSIYLSIYLCIVTSNQKKTTPRFIKSTQGIHATPWAENILVCPNECAAYELAVFSIDISATNHHMASQTCCRSIYFVTELTLVLSSLLLKDFCKASP